MPSDGSYHTAEGSSRKRVKISRDAGRPAGLSKSPETVDLVTPAKLEPPAPAIKTESEEANTSSKTPCHHEQSLRSLHGDLDEMRQLITCKICQRFLYEPYALTCGHTFCYSCLSQWMGQNKSKTCPDCRTVIKDEPAPSYLIRELVLIFIGRSALLPDGEISEEHNQLAKEEADIVAKDRANTHVETGGLFKGSFKKGTRRAPVEAIRDHSDNVYRCPECTSEVEDGQCSGCGIRVRTEEDDLAWSSDEESDDSDDLELDHELEAEDYDDDTELGLIDAHADVWDPYQQPHPPWQLNEWGAPAPSSEVDLSQDEHDEFMDGFIDDEPLRDAYWSSDDEQGGQSEATEVNNNPPQRRRRIEEVSESDEEEEEDEEPARPTRRRIMTVRVPRRVSSEAPSSAAASVVSDPSDSEDQEGGSDEEDDEDEEPIRTSQRNRGRRAPARSHRVVSVRSEDDDSDAEANVTNQSEAGGFSPIQPAPRAPQQQEHVNYYDDSDVESEQEDEETEHEHDHSHYQDRYQDRNQYEDAYEQYNGGYDEDESDGDGYDDQSIRGQAPSTGSYTHRLHALGPHRSRHVNRPTEPPPYGSLYPDEAVAPYSRRLAPVEADVHDFNRRFFYHPQAQRGTATAPSGQYRPPTLTYHHPFNLDNTLAGIHQRTEPLRRRDRATTERRHRHSGFSSQSSAAGGVEVSSQGSGSSGSSRTVR